MILVFERTYLPYVANNYPKLQGPILLDWKMYMQVFTVFWNWAIGLQAGHYREIKVSKCFKQMYSSSQ